MTIRYAVLFKVHYWDDFTERRFQHLLRKVGAGDVCVFADETHGTVGEIPHDHVIRTTERDMEVLGVLAFPPGRVFWYDVDYPLYHFYLQNKDYDYYLMLEHDAVSNVNTDDIVRIAEKDRVDYIGFPYSSESGREHWLETCEGVYPKSVALHKWLNCLSLFSRRSVEFLLDRRRILTRRFNAGEITNWPNNEPFIATEMLNNGFVTRPLGDFGKVEKYNWWPPTRESDLPALQDQAFLHPVLDEQKYVASCLRHGRLRSYLWPTSKLRRLLEEESMTSIIPALLIESKRRILVRAFGRF